MKLKGSILASLLMMATSSTAAPYLIADRTVPAKLKVLGISGLDPDGCPSGMASCQNIVIRGQIERVGYVEGGDFPNLLRVRDLTNGRVYSIPFPYRRILNSIGTADSSWIGLWPKPGLRVTVIGTIGGSAAMVSIDSIYDSRFLSEQGQP